MHAYIVNPNLVLNRNNLASEFFEKLKLELDEHIASIEIKNEMVMASINLTKKDVLIFFNNNSSDYPQYFIEFLEEAKNKQCSIFPIAISENHRQPPCIVSCVQSYDIVEQLHKRKLMVAQVDTIATVFSRDIVSILQPTLTRKNMKLFLSHRRLDGEHIAGAFHDALQVRMQNSFRDINAVFVGEEAQEIIETNLRKSDAVIFLDTPKCGDSSWVEKELRMALLLHIPIVWVKIGSDDNRASLLIKPAGEPHFKWADIDTNKRSISTDRVDAVIQKAFEISREHAKKIFECLSRVRRLKRNNQIELIELCSQKLTFEVQIPRKNFRYLQRPITHIVRLYGRIPQDEDKTDFEQDLKDIGYEPHPRLGNIYDASIMIAPMALQEGEFPAEKLPLIDSGEDYVNSLEQYLQLSKKADAPKRGVIISGAFPDCEPEYQQNLTDAIHAFTSEILNREGIIIFGAHPTFQHLIFGMAKQKKPSDFIKAVHLYISKYFVTDAVVDELQHHATVTASNQEGTRAQSLTLMRKKMIADPDAACMIVMGGKTHRPNIPPGVDEEIELAKSAGIPIFYVGSVGGRSAELASGLDGDDWKGKNNHLSEEFNRKMLVSLDYRVLAKELFDGLGL